MVCWIDFGGETGGGGGGVIPPPAGGCPGKKYWKRPKFYSPVVSLPPSPSDAAPSLPLTLSSFPVCNRCVNKACLHWLTAEEGGPYIKRRQK